MTWTAVLRQLPAQGTIAFRGANSVNFLPAGPPSGGQWSGVYFGSTTDHSVGYIELENGVGSLWTAALPQILPVIFATGTSYGDPTIPGDIKAQHLRQEAANLGLNLPDTGQVITDLGSIGYGYVGVDSEGTRELIIGHNLIAAAPVPVTGTIIAYVNRQNYVNQGWSAVPTGPFNQPQPANQTSYIQTMT
ncbi:hypothetical protein K7W42_15735 [Deinococcus sp. HMF7604]|uniref:hypothetical protein n=1 Tax=Deinococcus betulae TaxID=2873312 RepID=UPI001CCDDEA7|nr:hypothetical protein [Deinococcus betulae]MBZ9752304.1 hypothetical protein [Deinococcus betulae]